MKNLPEMDPVLYKFCKDKEPTLAKQGNSLSKYADTRWDEMNAKPISDAISHEPKLKELFGDNMPTLLGSKQFEIKMRTPEAPFILGQGTASTVFLAEDTQTKQLFAVKLFNDKHYDIKAFLREYIYTKLSYTVLNGHVKGLDVKGIISMNSAMSKSVFKYGMIIEYASLVPGSATTLTLNEAIALGENSHFNVISPQNWAQIILSLISAAEQMKDNGMAHLDLHGDNMMIQFTENNEIALTVIDFGDAQGFYGNMDVPIYLRTEDDDEDGYSDPALFHQGIPLPTSDLYAVALYAFEIADFLALDRLKRSLKSFREMDYKNRIDHETLRAECKRWLQHLLN